jgi:S1-C subfamily serine protease
VILELGGKTVNNLADLQKAVQETDLKQPQTMVIFRSQKENKLTLPGNLLK